MNNSFFLILILNLIFCLFLNYIKTYYNLYDFPDFKRKIHRQKVPLLGGFLILLNLLVILILNIFNENILNKNFFLISYSYLLMYLTLILFFILGFVDDKYKVNANNKLILSIAFIFILIYFDQTLILNVLEFSFTEFKLFLGIYSIPFTILCFVLFINAFNMIDGINGQAMSYALFIILLFIQKNILTDFFILLSISFFIYLILNFLNKTYLGDSGALLVSFLISYIFVKNNNSVIIHKFYSDEIFLIMLVPGFELVRVAITRIIKKKHPFSADNLHLHHILIKNLGYVKSYFIIQILFFFPYFFYLVLNDFFISFFQVY